MLNVVTYVFPVLGGVFMLTMPACLQLNFMISSFCGVGASFLLRMPSVRNYFQLHPFVQPDEGAGPEKLNMAAPQAGAAKATKKAKHQAPTVKSSITVPGARVQPPIRSSQPSSPTAPSSSQSASNPSANSRSNSTASSRPSTPTSTPARNPVTFAKDVVVGGYKEITGALGEIKSQAMSSLGQAQKKRASGRSPAAEKEAKEYEERRQRELQRGEDRRPRG